MIRKVEGDKVSKRSLVQSQEIVKEDFLGRGDIFTETC